MLQQAFTVINFLYKANAFIHRTSVSAEMYQEKIGERLEGTLEIIESSIVAGHSVGKRCIVYCSSLIGRHDEDISLGPDFIEVRLALGEILKWQEYCEMYPELGEEHLKQLKAAEKMLIDAMHKDCYVMKTHECVLGHYDGL
jgi:hypothetical protein